MTRNLILAGAAALTLGGATLTTTPAGAQIYEFRPGAGSFRGHWQPMTFGGVRSSGSWGVRPGGYYGGFRPARFHGGYRPVGFYGGYRPAYYGGYYPYRHYPRYGYFRHRRSNAGAVAAGLIGGLALGALAASAAQPYYYPYYPATTVATSCWIERRRVYDRWGRLVITRVQVCA